MKIKITDQRIRSILALLVCAPLCSTAGALEVITTSAITVQAVSSTTRDVLFDYRLDILNMDPALGGEPVTFFHDWGVYDCFQWNNDNRSFCCVGENGNTVRGTRSTRSNPCPIGAVSSTFAFAAGAFDDSFTNCVLRCINDPNGSGNSPIIVSLDDQNIKLTDLSNSVAFDLNLDDETEHLSWTAPGVYDGFLALDRNDNAVIDDGSELFGDVTIQRPGEERNGFRALALYDEIGRGGNGDGSISSEDEIFASLRIWFDLNHDGLSQESELRSLSDLEIREIDLEYTESRRRDRYGNEFRYRGTLTLNSGKRKPVWDVFLLRGE